MGRGKRILTGCLEGHLRLGVMDVGYLPKGSGEWMLDLANVDTSTVFIQGFAIIHASVKVRLCNFNRVIKFRQLILQM